jgi:hypothetical protein
MKYLFSCYRFLVYNVVRNVWYTSRGVVETAELKFERHKILLPIVVSHDSYDELVVLITYGSHVTDLRIK